jgi:23S rRNA (guanosine2251-2'-O)-methyltransferase
LNKTGLGSENSVLWTYSNNAVTIAKKIKNDGFELWCLEEGDNSISLPDSLSELARDKIVLIVGNEVSGIDPELRHLSDRTVFIPMQGYKRSLNVAIAFSIAAYLLRYGSRKD